MKIAAYQSPIPDADSPAMIARIAKRVEWCEANGVVILCCPEAVLGGLADDAADPTAIAVDVESGELARLLAPLASATVTTIIGFTEKGEAATIFNSVAVLSGGNIIGIYRKRHPAIRESIYSAGTKSPLFTIAGVTFGIMICNDSNFPELAAGMAARGAGLLLIPSNNALKPEKADIGDRAREIDVARALATGASVVRADVAGTTATRIAYGTSIMVDARGNVISTARPFAEDLLVNDIARLL